MRSLDAIPSPAPMSAVGFGCASLGSRIGRREGLAALERAFEAGITWYDVAPSYGDGMAESILGQFLNGRRQSVNVCTKVGLRAATPAWKALLRPVARMVVSRMPTLRKYATRSRTVARVPIEADQIVQSVDRSLAQLGIDRLDALLLHDPLVEDVARPDVTRALMDLRSSGKVGSVGVAGSLEAARRATNHPDVFSIIQLANNPFEPYALQPWLDEWRNSGRLLITHSAFGNAGSLSVLIRLIDSDGEVKDMLAGAGYEGAASTVAASFLTDYAIQTNSTGICLFSVMRADHLAALRQRVEAQDRIATDPVVALGEALLGRMNQIST